MCPLGASLGLAGAVIEDKTHFPLARPIRMKKKTDSLKHVILKQFDSRSHTPSDLVITCLYMPEGWPCAQAQHAILIRILILFSDLAF